MLLQNFYLGLVVILLAQMSYDEWPIGSGVIFIIMLFAPQLLVMFWLAPLGACKCCDSALSFRCA